MSFKGTLRRTLALLLVLIFALSNMGLAEMAEQIAESIPEAEPQIEETAAEEAASEPTEDAQAAPDEGAPAAEQEEPAPAAESVSVFVQAIDETELCAYETIEPAGAYDVSYMWERAESADGEWTALDETSDVLKSEAEDRAAYVYRCTVTVDGISATSDPATYDWGVEAAAEADEPAMIGLGDSIDMAELGAEGDITWTTQPRLEGGTGSNTIVFGQGNEAEIKLESVATVNVESGDQPSYEWSLDEPVEVEGDETATAARFLKLSTDDGTYGPTKAKVKVGLADWSTATNALIPLDGLTVKVKLTVSGTTNQEKTDSKTVDIKILKTPSENELKAAIKLMDGEAEINPGDDCYVARETSANDITPSLTGLDAYNPTGENVEWKVSDDETFAQESTWITVSADSGTKLSVKALDTAPQFTSTDADGHTVYVQASLKLFDDTKVSAHTGKITIRPVANSVKVKLGDAVLSAEGTEVPNTGKITLTAVPSVQAASVTASGEFTAESVKCIDKFTWTVTEAANDGAASEDKLSYSFTPDTSKGKKTYTIGVASDINVGTVKAENLQLTVAPLPAADNVTAKQEKYTLVKDGENENATLTVDFGDKADVYKKVTWTIDKGGTTTNKWGTSNKPFIEKVEDSDGPTLQIRLANDIGQGTGIGDDAKPGPVHVTATVQVAGGEKEIVFLVYARSKTTATLAPDDIKLTSDTLGQPGLPADKDQPWAKASASIDNIEFDGLTVTWAADTTDDSDDYIEVDEETGAIRAYYVGEEGKENTFADNATAGKTVTITATIGDGDEATTAKKTLTVYPTHEIFIGEASSTTSTTAKQWFEDEDDTYTIQAGGNLYLMFAVNKPSEKTVYFGEMENEVTVVENPGTDDEKTIDPPKTLNAKGILTLDATKAITYHLTAVSTTDEREFTVKVMPRPNTVKFYNKEKNFDENDDAKELSNQIFLQNSGETTLDVFAYPETTDGKLAYGANLDWYLSAGSGTSAVAADKIQKDPVEDGGTVAEKIFLEAQEDAPSKYVIHIPENSDALAGKTFNLNLQAGTGTIYSKTFTIMKTPGNDIFDGATIKIGTGYKDIIQGETLDVTLTPGTTQATELAKYTLAYEIIADTDTNVAKISDWVNIDKKSGNYAATLTAPEAGDDNTLTEAQKEGLKFKIHVTIPGVDDTTVYKDETFTLVAKPAGVKVVLWKDDGTAVETDPTLPLSIPINDSINLSSEFVADKAADSATEYDLPGLTAGAAAKRLPVLSLVSTSSSTATLSRPNKPDVTPTEPADYWTLAARGTAGTAKIQATWGDLTTTVEIVVTNQSGITAADGSTNCPNKGDAGATNTENYGKPHVWVLKTGDTFHADGHVYVCKYCGKPSNTVAHEQFKVVVNDGTNPATGKPYTEDDVKLYDAHGQNDAGKIACIVCGYVCDHQKYGKLNGYGEDGATRTAEGNYHVATCPICKQELLGEHDDQSEDNICDICDAPMAQATLTNAKNAVVIVGSEDAFTPVISVSATQTWAAKSFKAKAGDEEYIDVDEATGAVTAKAVKPDESPATVEATLTVTTTVQDTKYEQDIQWSFQVAIKNPTGELTVTSNNHDSATNTDYVIGGNAIKLTVASDQEQANLDGYKWTITGGGADAEKFYFVKENAKTGKADTDSAVGNDNTLLSAQSIWLYADNSTTISKSYTGKDALKVSYTNGKEDAEIGEISIDVLKPLTVNDPSSTYDATLSGAITFGTEHVAAGDAVKIVEGNSADLSMKTWTQAEDGKWTSTPFDTRYGTVTFDITEASGMTKANIKKYIEISGNNKVVTKTGMLSNESTKTKTFTVTATVVTGKDADGKDQKAVGTHNVTIVPAPTKITYKYRTADTGAFTDLPKDGLEVFEDSTIYLQATVVNPEGLTGGVTADELSWSCEPASSVVTTGDNKSGVVDGEAGVYKCVIAKGASDFVVTASCFGMSEPLTIKVKKLITDIQLSVENAKVAVGEEDETKPGEFSPKQIKVTYTPVPADAKDTVTFAAYEVPANYKLGDDYSTYTELTGIFTKVQGDDYSQTISVENSITRSVYPKILIVATATQSKETVKGQDDPQNVARGTIIELYKEPDEDAFVLETANGESDIKLTVDASVKVTKHGYDTENGYGASTGAELPIVAKDNSVKDADGKDVVPAQKVIEIDGDTITALHEGTATIAVRGFNYDDHKEAEKTLTIEVTGKLDELITTDEGKIEDSYSIGIGKAAALKIDKNIFHATRTTETGVESIGDDEAKIELLSDNNTDGIVSITDGKTEDGDDGKWVIEGKKAGTVQLYAGVGSSKSAAFTVKVGDKAEGIQFVDAEGNIYDASKTQIQRKVSQTDPIVLTAKSVPETAFGDVTVDPATGAGCNVTIEGTKITATPTGVGVTRITAKIPNPDWSGEGEEDDLPTDPQYLTGYVEIVVVSDDTEIVDPGTTETSAAVEFVGKKAIGPKETTTLVVTGIDAGKTVTWSAAAGETIVKLTPSTDSKSVTVEHVAAGKDIVTATVDGKAVGTANIYTLTAPAEAVLDRTSPLVMAVGEELELTASVTDGYTWKDADSTPAADENVTIEDDDLFSFTSSNEKLLTVTNYNGKFTAKAVKKPGKNDAAPSLTMSVKGGESVTVPVTINAKNTGFTVDANGSTLYLAPGGKPKDIPVTFKPKTSPANLKFVITDKDGQEVADSGIVITQTTTGIQIVVDEGAATGEIYTVKVQAEGYTDHAEQSFKVVVQDEPTEGAELKVAVEKVGVANAYTQPAVDAITAVKNEKLQAMIVDAEGNPVAGDVVWGELTAAQKKKVTISNTGLITVKGTSGSVAISATVGGAAAGALTINLAKSTNVKPALDPADTARTVAVGEEFKLALTGAYPDANAAKWFTIDWSNDLGAAPVEDEEKANTYTFAKAGVTTATVKPVWGGKGYTVKFTVVGEDEAATSFDVPEELTIAAPSTTYVRATMEGVASLRWLAGTEVATATEITTKEIKYNGSAAIKLKKLANDEIQIKTTKNASGAIDLLVVGPGAEDGAPIKVTIGAADTALPADAKVAFDKQVITVGESTTVYLVDENGAVVTPSGTVSYKFKSVSGAGKASVKGNVVKATKKGEVTVTAKLGSGTPIEGKLYVVDKATIVPALKPATMGEHETLTMDVTVKNYDASLVPEDYKELLDTTGILTAETNSPMITATISQEEDTETPNVFQLTLAAGDAVKTSKGKFTSATVTLRLTNGQKSTMKIQVVEAADETEVYVPSMITLAPKTSVKLVQAVAEGSAYAANFDWHFATPEDAEAAKTHLLTIENGKVVAAQGATATTEPIMIEGSYNGGEIKTIAVSIAAAKAKAKQFKITKPGRGTVYIGEKFLAGITFDPGVGGSDITWKTSKPKIVSVNKTTGLYTVIGPVGKTTNISATVNGKSSDKVQLTVAAAPSTVAFDVTDLAVTKGASGTLLSNVKLDGAALTDTADYSSVLTFSEVDGSDANNILTVNSDGTYTLTSEDVEGTAAVKVTTYNGLSARILFVLGNGNGGDEPVVPEQDYDPASIKLMMGGKELSGYTAESDNPLVMDEDDVFQLTAVVRDKDGISFNPKDGVTWTAGGDNNVEITGTGLNVTMKAAKATVNEDGRPSPVKVSAQVTAKDGTVYSDEFYVLINYTLRKENIELTVEPGSLLVNSEATATFRYKVTDVERPDAVVTVENLTEDILEVTEAGSNWTIKGKAVGVGQVQVILKESSDPDAKILIDDYIKEIPVNALPTSDQIKIKDGAGNDITGGTLTVGAGETGKFEVELPSTFVPGDGDIQVKITEMEADDDGEYTDITTTTSDYETDTAGNELYSKFTISGTITDTTKHVEKQRVVVSVYDEQNAANAAAGETVEPIAQTFTLEIKEAPSKQEDILIDATPAFTDGTADKDYADAQAITTAVGEPVTLVASLGKTADKKADLTWTQGLVWTVADEPAADSTEPAPEGFPTIERSEDGQTITITPTSADAYQTIQATVAPKNSAGTAAASATRTITITVKAKPTEEPDSSLVAVDTAAKLEQTTDETAYILGEKEKVEVSVDFTGKDYFTDEIFWATGSQSISLSSTTGAKITVTGVASTTGSKLTLTAYAGTDATGVKLGDVKFEVAAAPTADEVSLKDCSAAGVIPENGGFTATFNADDETSEKYVAVDMGKKSATFELTTSSPAIKPVGIANAKNAWKLTYVPSAAMFQSGDNSVTLTLTCKELGIRKNYNLTVTATRVVFVPSPERKEQLEGMGVNGDIETTTPGATIEGSGANGEVQEEDVEEVTAGGFFDDMTDNTQELDTPPTPEKYVNNQKTVEANSQPGSDGKSMTITISADVNQMNEWQSTENGKKKGHWYLIVIDTGMKTEDMANHEIYISTNGTKPTSQAANFTSASTDIADAKAFSGGKVEVGFPLWLDIDDLLTHDSYLPVQLFIRETGGSNPWPAEPYMTFNIVKGSVTGNPVSNG